MWGIEFNAQGRHTSLPLITSEAFIGLCLGLLGMRVGLQYMLEQWFGVRAVRKEHSPRSLEFSYFYHLSIIVLGLGQLNWNLFDLLVWIFSYVCVGMLRKAIHTINIQRQFLINDYAYNNAIVRLLTNSTRLAALTLGFSFAYTCSIHCLFLGVQFKVLSMLSFPSLMLLFDSVFLLVSSRRTQQHLVYFYNQNINGISPLTRPQLYYSICRNALKCSHFFNLTVLCSAIIMERVDFLDCMWIVSVVGAFYSSALDMIKAIYKYKQMQKLIGSISRILAKVKGATDQICIICMEPLLNSHRLVQCGHLFHYKCLFQWIQTKEECPVCRVRINLNA